MTELSCKNCAAPLDMAEAKNGVIACSFCGSVFTLPKSGQTDEVKRLIDAGKTALDVCRFDDAFASYSKAVELDGSEPEAYWGRALARFRVQYLRDTVNNRLQPICREAGKDAFTADPDYRKALSLATPEQRAEYGRQAAEIDYIREEFLALARKNLSYDCFICVKVTDDDGKPTADSRDADRIYTGLKEAGYKPFYSEYELRGRAGAQYEALILYALHKAPCMLVVCSDEKYLETKWVKNEYARFAAMIGDEEKERDSLTIAYRGRVIEHLPGIQGKIQGVDLAGVDAMDNIRAFIDGHTGRRRGRSLKRSLLDAVGEIPKVKALREKFPDSAAVLDTVLSGLGGKKEKAPPVDEKAVAAARDRRRTSGSLVCLVLMAALLALMITVQCAVTGWVKRPLWLGLWIAAVAGGALVFLIGMKAGRRDSAGWKTPVTILVVGSLALLALYIWFAFYSGPTWLTVTVSMLCFALAAFGLIGLIWLVADEGKDSLMTVAVCVLLAFVHFFIVGLGKQAPFYQYDGYQNGFFYTVHADDTAELVMYDTAETLVIPQALRGAAVVSAKIDGAQAYGWEDETVEKLVVDDAFTVLPDINFTLSDFRNLREASVNGLSSLPSFRGCESLRTVHCAGAQEISADTFSGCTALTAVGLGEGLKTIGKDAFKDCSFLRELHIPAGTETVQYAFSGCTALTVYFHGVSEEDWNRWTEEIFTETDGIFTWGDCTVVRVP